MVAGGGRTDAGPVGARRAPLACHGVTPGAGRPRRGPGAQRQEGCEGAAKLIALGAAKLIASGAAKLRVPGAAKLIALGAAKLRVSGAAKLRASGAAKLIAAR